MRLLLVTCFLAALFQNTWAQGNNMTTEVPNSNTTASSNATASSNTTTSSIGNTTVSNNATSTTPSTSSNSTATANSTVTQPPASPNITSNVTTPASSNTTDSNSTTTLSNSTTTLPTTTVATTEPPPVKFNSDTAVFILKLTVGTNSTADVMYHNPNVTREQLLANISQYFEQLCSIDLTSSPSDGTHYLLLKFFFNQIYGINSTLEERIVNATIDLNNTESEFMVSSNTLEKISTFFQQSSSNPCLASNVCPVGHDCQVRGCFLSANCGTDTCNGNGQCVISLAPNMETMPKCICNENYDTEYYGDQCENSRTGKLQIIAIISGVLGAAILVLLVIIIIICVTQRRKGSGYEVSKGHKNKAYDGDLTS